MTDVEPLESRSLLSALQPVEGIESSLAAGEDETSKSTAAGAVDGELLRIRLNLQKVHENLQRIQQTLVRLQTAPSTGAPLFSTVEVEAKAPDPAATEPRAEDFDAVGHGVLPQLAADKLRTFRAFSSR